jgi:iron complex outermembrane receptor protein
VFRQPRGDFPFDFATDPINPQASFLADEQDNLAWAVFGELAYDFSDQLEGTFSLRYDEDERENTTITPEPFLPVSQSGIPQEGSTGEVRTKTWDDLQPRVSLRYSISDTASWYGSLSRGFRSGGFNQTGVETVAMELGFPGVGDTFDQEITETIEVGYKGVYNDGRVTTSFSAFHTEAEGTYFFIFIADNSTQNLGNLLGTDYTGLEFDLAASINDYVDFNLGIGYTDSEITDSLHAPDIGDKAPNVPEYTVNLGLQYRGPTNSSGARFFARGDYQIIGDTAFWDFNQDDTNDRDPVHLLDFRLGWESPNNWAATLWGKNALDEEYHTEYSTGGFVFKAPPARFGIDFTKEF